jgi:hypothetical protein
MSFSFPFLPIDQGSFPPCPGSITSTKAFSSVFAEAGNTKNTPKQKNNMVQIFNKQRYFL